MTAPSVGTICLLFKSHHSIILLDKDYKLNNLYQAAA